MMGKVWQQGAPEVARRSDVCLEGQCLQVRAVCVTGGRKGKVMVTMQASTRSVSDDEGKAFRAKGMKGLSNKSRISGRKWLEPSFLVLTACSACQVSYAFI